MINKETKDMKTVVMKKSYETTFTFRSFGHVFLIVDEEHVDEIRPLKSFYARSFNNSIPNVAPFINQVGSVLN